jgi:hypothetical protein
MLSERDGAAFRGILEDILQAGVADVRPWSGPLAGLFYGRVFFLGLHHHSLILF